MARAIFDSITKQDTDVRQSRDQRAAEARDSSIKSYRVKSARESLCEVSGRTTERICERNACRRGMPAEEEDMRKMREARERNRQWQ